MAIFYPLPPAGSMIIKTLPRLFSPYIFLLEYFIFIYLFFNEIFFYYSNEFITSVVV